MARADDEIVIRPRHDRKAGQLRLATWTTHRDRGAAAVEFALLLPLLLLIVFGIIDFGRALNAQLTLTQAAQDGARVAALNQPDVAGQTQAAATGLTGLTVTVTACPAPAAPGANAVVDVSYPFSFVTPVGGLTQFFGHPLSQITLTAHGVMPCES
jgi:Flp pilus assembly protein TadG